MTNNLISRKLQLIIKHMIYQINRQHLFCQIHLLKFLFISSFASEE